jgi:hypothetical protein
MIMSWCKKCGEFIYYKGFSHKCNKFEIALEGEDFEYDNYAIDFEDAAEKFAEEYDNDDCEIVNGSPIIISVKNEEGVVKKFEIEGEAVPTYYARELDV